jgi:predicted enzyme related to lactoylglutathione lyase
MLKLNSVMIGSENPAALADFYTKFLGEPAWKDSGFTGWLAGPGYLGVGPHDQVKGKNSSPGRIMWHFETDDVKGEFERLKSAGAAVVAEPYQPGGGDMWLATLADPDGNYFQLASPWKDEAKS